MRIQKKLMLGARVISMVFTPFYLPTLGLICLFLFSYMSLLPTYYKWMVVGLTYAFTVVLPTLMIYFYRKYQRWSLLDLGRRERRMVPYVMSIICYWACVYVMRILIIPHFMTVILIAALGIQIVCAIINVWWKISTHTAGIGGVTGALLAFSEIFGFNPTVWLCVVIIVAGVLGSSRMILRQHTLSEVVGGYIVGCVCGLSILVI